MEYDEIKNDNKKQRHGCVTAWLIFMIIANSASSLLYLLASEIVVQNLPGSIPTSMILSLGILGVVNVISAVMLLNWRKIGFWAFIVTGLASMGINISIGLGVGQSIVGLFGIAVLFGILQIKKDEKSTWENLE